MSERIKAQPAPRDLWEAVADRMARSRVGELSSYETILNALRERFKTEAELRAKIAEGERLFAFLQPGFRFLNGEDFTRH